TAPLIRFFRVSEELVWMAWLFLLIALCRRVTASVCRFRALSTLMASWASSFDRASSVSTACLNPVVSPPGKSALVVPLGGALFAREMAALLRWIDMSTLKDALITRRNAATFPDSKILRLMPPRNPPLGEAWNCGLE